MEMLTLQPVNDGELSDLEINERTIDIFVTFPSHQLVSFGSLRHLEPIPYLFDIHTVFSMS